MSFTVACVAAWTLSLPVATPLAPERVVLAARLTAQAPLQEFVRREPVRLEASAPRRAAAVKQQDSTRRSWISRHPALFGAAVGFATGFAIGFIPGDDGVFDDFEASFNGLVLGGVGAPIGAIVGAVVGRVKR